MKQPQPDYQTWIGTQVIKKSDRPFKSQLRHATVKSIILHPQKHVPAFTFEEDDSYVECSMCMPKIQP